MEGGKRYCVTDERMEMECDGGGGGGVGIV